MSIALLKRALRRRRRHGLVRDCRGESTVETAMIVFALSLLIVGVIDFSLAFARKSEMSNAVRAGVQFALARHPSIGPSATTNDTIVSLQNIRDAVVTAASFLTTDPGSPDLDVNLFCQCPDGSAVTCDPNDTTVCTGRHTYIQITLRNSYNPILYFPGVANGAFTLESGGSVQLN